MRAHDPGTPIYDQTRVYQGQPIEMRGREHLVERDVDGKVVQVGGHDQRLAPRGNPHAEVQPIWRDDVRKVDGQRRQKEGCELGERAGKLRCSSLDACRGWVGPGDGTPRAGVDRDDHLYQGLGVSRTARPEPKSEMTTYRKTSRDLHRFTPRNQ